MSMCFIKDWVCVNIYYQGLGVREQEEINYQGLGVCEQEEIYYQGLGVCEHQLPRTGCV